MNDENTKTETPTYDEAYFASEARFVYMRPEIDASIAAGTPAEQALTPFGELPEDVKQRWINTVVHIVNLLQAMNKESKEVEESGADGTPDANPIPSYQDIREAYDRLAKLVDAYGDLAILQLVLNNGDDGDFLHTCSPPTFSASGKSSRLFEWGAARGYMMRARRCLNSNAEAIGEGVKYLILESRNEKKTPMADLIDFLSGKED